MEEATTEDMESHARAAKILRDWTLIEGGSEQQEDEEPMAQDPCVKTMLQAGRLHLNAYPERTADDYSVKQAMALAAPKHDAAQQQQALLTLRAEFQKRSAAKA